jgi:biopolymer transport protein ExbD
MARRELAEINAGSMADIAFLLLIFWLVTTTIDSDEGIKRQLPPPVPEDMVDVPPVKEQNVFNVKVNFLDQLLVEGEVLEIGSLKDQAKNFLVATGDGIMVHPVGRGSVGKSRDVEFITGANGKTNAVFPERVWVRKAELLAQVAQYEGLMAGATDVQKRNYLKLIDHLNEKLTAIELFGGDYKELPGSALISMQNDNNTSYDIYLQVQNELQSAVNELRDELSVAKFGKTYRELEDEYDRNAEDMELLSKIAAVRLVYPQRISEAEPREGSAYY